jgi:hypothetical protein
MSARIVMRRQANRWRAGLVIGQLLGALALGTGGSARAAGPKYYFQVRDVKAGPEVDPALKAYAAEALKNELASRPEWASKIETPEAAAAVTPDALVTELKKRGLRGFDVTLRMEWLKRDVKEPNPGARRKRLAVGTRLTVFGTTIPEAKLAFSGDGEAGTESEVSDRRMEEEGLSLAKDAIKDAIKQAVDQAVLKLSLGQSAPMNESKRKRKK